MQATSQADGMAVRTTKLAARRLSVAASFLTDAASVI
jgi:hypothetical protein